MGVKALQFILSNLFYFLPFLTSPFEDVFSESLGLIMATAPGNSLQICTTGIITLLNGWLKLKLKPFKTMKIKFWYHFFVLADG